MTDYSYSLGETYTGARATPELVGRDFELAEIYHAIEDASHSYIIYITSDGGRGKTRLARHILQHPPENARVITAQDVVDLYHTPARTVEGLLERVRDVFPDNFPHYDAKRQELNQRLAGYGSILPAQYEELREAFFTDWDVLAKQQRIVLVLDTVEKLHRQEDLAAKALGLAEDRPVILEWLFGQFLSQAQNFVLVLAGRPYLENFETELHSALTDTGRNDIEFKPLALSGFTEDAALAYLDAVVRTSEQGDENDQRVAAFVRDLSEDSRRVIFQCLRETESPVVAPILLALAIDYLAVTGALPEFGYSLEEACALTSEQREGIRQKLGADLVAAIMEKRRPADEIIKALGWLRKGGTVELLAAVAQMSQVEVAEMLEKVQDLSFIKRRPSDNRYFLHDEMYDLIQRHALEHVSPQRREEIFQTIREYYKTQIEQARVAIAELYEDESELPDPVRVVQTRVQLEDLLIEYTFYQLRWDAVDGFETYFLYAEEAIATLDVSLDDQLRSELLNFLAERDPSGMNAEIDGLYRATVLMDTAVRWVKRFISNNRYDKALGVVHAIRRGVMAADIDSLSNAELLSWEALAMAYKGDHETANQMLSQAITGMPKQETIRSKAILARIYNNRGYVRRALGYYWGALPDYQESLRLWKDVDIGIEVANTQNNLAFAKAEAGWFSAAERLAESALARRRKLGARVPVGLSLNTFAHIKIRVANYSEAQRYAEAALVIFEQLKAKREIGLAFVALAEALRRMGEKGDNAEMISRAIQYAEQGAEIFGQLKAADREIEALIELGCAYRDLAKIVRGPKPKLSNITEEIEAIAANGVIALEKAADKAKSTLWLSHFQINALVNLAWLHYYVLRDQVAEDVLQQAENLTPESYHIKPLVKFPNGDSEGGLPALEKNNAIVPLLIQLGKIELLRGQIAFNNFERTRDVNDLEKAIEHYTLSLAYDTFFHDEASRELRRGMDRIYEHIEGLDLRQLIGIVINIEQKYGIESQKSKIRRFLEEHL